MYLPRELPKPPPQDPEESSPPERPEHLDSRQRVIELRHPLPPGPEKSPNHRARPSLLHTANAARRRCAHLVSRFPGVTVLLCAMVVWFIVDERHAVIEEQLESRVRELAAQVETLSRRDREQQSPSEQPAEAASRPEGERAPSLPDGENHGINGPAKRDSREAIVQRKLSFDGSERDDPFVGPSDAPVLVMLITDLQCVRCGEFYMREIRPLLEQFRHSADTRLMLRDLPLPSNSHAEDAAQLAQCAGEQGRYFEALDALIASRKQVAEGNWTALTKSIGVEHPDRLLRCLQSRRYASEVERDRQFALSLGATGVPTTFVGRRSADGTFSGELIRGAQPQAILKAALKRAGSTVH